MNLREDLEYDNANPYEHWRCSNCSAYGKMTRVTFDANVWRKVASPSTFLNDPDIGIYVGIAQIKTKGSAGGGHWLAGIKDLPDSEKNPWPSLSPSEPTPMQSLPLSRTMSPTSARTM